MKHAEKIHIVANAHLRKINCIFYHCSFCCY